MSNVILMIKLTCLIIPDTRRHAIKLGPWKSIVVKKISTFMCDRSGFMVEAVEIFMVYK